MRFVIFTVPSGIGGVSQSTLTEINKSGPIAKERILVEQVIRHLKTVRIIANEVSSLLVSHFEDIVIVCSALWSFFFFLKKKFGSKFAIYTFP